MEKLISGLCEKYGYTECLKLLGKKKVIVLVVSVWFKAFIIMYKRLDGKDLQTSSVLM